MQLARSAHSGREDQAPPPCKLAPAWPEVEILSVMGVSVTMACGSSGALAASAAASVVPAGLRAVSGPWFSWIRLRCTDISPPNCSWSMGAGRLPSGPTGSGLAPSCSCPRSFMGFQVSGKVT